MEGFKNKYPHAKSFEDFRNEISIIELATANGYHHEAKKGSRTPVFYNPQTKDRIIIINPHHPGNQGYWNPEDDTDKGSLINFVKRRLGTLFPQDNTRSENANVNAVLYGYLKLPEPAKQQNRQLVNPERLQNIEAHKFLNDYYKIKPLHDKDFFRVRNISLDTLEKPEFTGRIFNVQYQDPQKPGLLYTNVAFPYHLANDTRIVGLEIRNTSYKAHAEGSDRSNGIWYSNMPEKLDRIVLVESALDALSYRELRLPDNTLFVSYGGNLSLNQIQTIKELKLKGNTNTNFQYVLANDNDKKGAYYDLMFLRDLAAEEFPSQRLANPKNSIKLAFASLNALTPGAAAPGKVMAFADKLMHELSPYNKHIDEEMKKRGLSNLVLNELDRDKIKYKIEGNQFLVEIPTTYFAMHQFNKAFVQATGLGHTIKIDKAILNDYNEDLTLVKLINKNPELLAEINKMDLHNKPEEKLVYSDLKWVILQPGRYEQFQKLLDLGKVKKEIPQILLKGKGGIESSKSENIETLKAENQQEKQGDLNQNSPQVKPKF
ncbi:toprim domain-containing protein [Adhaeribacter rhizoryzae]|uniref:Toprim domain-containing protein n=1 Tax=Adhaeribacter rhizoryzae TaxID=2607907 RepID=A0A5M6D3T6_9BACT|nr:toprim domain-containing protein [Adhaeribacter rhizoryzae]KAA5541983.1 toprim domain-containing protein [Adhaeribacter rhizoryzae]